MLFSDHQNLPTTVLVLVLIQLFESDIEIYRNIFIIIRLFESDIEISLL